MKRLTALVFLAAQAQSPDPRDITDQFEVPEGLHVTLWAESPQLFNPTNLDIDARGRVWVTEGVNYRGKHRSAGFLQHPEGDRVMILEDTDGDGACDSSRVFVQSKDLVSPLGVGVLGDKVLVSCSPAVTAYDAERPGPGEVFLKGFGGRDHDHGVHAFVAGPDGRWYFNVGNMGPHRVTDASGWNLRAGSVNGGGRNRKSDDGRVWVGGLALRVEPDGSRLAVVAHNFRNNYELALDSYGNIWQSDNDDDGNQSCRMNWILEGGNYGLCSPDGARNWNADQRPGQATARAHWHQDDPGVVPTGDISGQGAPTGLVVYEGSLLPPRFRGMILGADAGRSLIYGYIPHPDGAGYRLERTVFLAGKSHTFRPSDVAVGIDGSLFIADWFDPVVGGHDMKDKAGYGRILRVAPKGCKPRIVPPSLESPAVNVRYAAWLKILHQGKDALPALEKIFGGADPVMRARALWLIIRIGGDATPALKDPDPNIRVTAFRALRQAGRHGDPLAALASDPSPAVRREVAVALRGAPLAEAKEILLELASRYDGKDRFYLEAFGIACDGKEEELYPLLLAKLGDPDPNRWSEAFAGLVWRLHPAAAIPALVTRARAGSASSLTALAFIRHADAADAMVDLAQSGPPELRPAALWWAKHRARNDWKEFDIASRLKEDRKESTGRPLREAFLNPEAKDRDKAARALAADKDGALWLIQLAADRKLPQELESVVAEEIFRNPDFGVRALAGEYFKRPGSDRVIAAADILKLPGNADRGQKIFFGPTAACSRCHAFDGEGAKVGPELTPIRAKYAKAEILDSILNPSASIAFGYDVWLIATKADAYSGFLLADGDTVVLKEASGETREIPAGEIVSRKKSALSMMPDNAALGLSAQELADVIEFLAGDRREY